MTTTNTSTKLNSPRGPGIGFEAAYMNDAWKSMASEGHRAIKELERILFFTDIQDNEAREEAARQGLTVLEDLENLLFSASSVDSTGGVIAKNTPSSDASDTTSNSRSQIQAMMDYRKLVEREIRRAVGAPELDEKSTTSTTTTTTARSASSSPTRKSTSTELAAPSFNIVDLLKAHFNAALASGQKAVKEAERKILFTDLDDTKTKQLGNNSVDVWKEVEVVLQEMEVKFAEFALETAQETHKILQQAGQKSRAAYKECERTLLFTDLDENKLAQDKTNDDVINHFLNTQDVFQELQQKFFRTKIAPKKEEEVEEGYCMV